MLSELNLPVTFRLHPPVLMILWMALATWPWSRELSSLTSSNKQVHRSRREQVSRMRPTVRSDNHESTNRWLPRDINRGLVQTHTFCPTPTVPFMMSLVSGSVPE
uniref:Uncharacterized protein n=1 Tax=Hucho hucho TaxID=62062 RepID=A0A4W5RHY5_9TELE